MPHADQCEIRIWVLLPSEHQPAVDQDRIDVVKIPDARKIDSSRTGVPDRRHGIRQNLALDIQVVLNHVGRPHFIGDDVRGRARALAPRIRGTERILSGTYLVEIREGDCREIPASGYLADRSGRSSGCLYLHQEGWGAESRLAIPGLIKQLEEQAEAASNRRLPVSANVPRKTYARSKVL